ncbi:cellulose biosynthesis cyclic di-GMP-binding regulatory protein BcsB [Pseudomonas asplenii]|uniref:cellulose biosynthesis cyclic di-GMP-binding regulatory protein BcsB n=1 Tax=Pseudomonas asplenii TaxID=53407 RepID=UPI00223432E6|nr:cellulose biosynthesis cyclic di-GMP-binding regulatory protein BcsB [Pseudomonas asplenii]UZE28885.1 cellulose biosynthesis cyclic di-GMP-binding regulatory protein BcsB [Pseudomonas asplenii]
MTTTSSVGSAGRCTRYALALLACGSLFPAIGSALPPAEVQGNTTTAPAVSPLPQASPANSYSLSFKQLGRRDPMYLRGVESTDSADFGIRTDQVVTGVQLVLRFSYSPSMLPELSQLNVLVNDKVAASLPLPKEEAGKDLEKVVEIPARLVTDFNRIDLQLIGHYTMQCEDPLHSSLWARVSNDSQLNIQYSPIALKNDLALLPAPFFDRHDARPLKLPFVFDAAPGPAKLEAAAALSSKFGALASYRTATFPASIGQLPSRGNAIVLVTRRDALPLGELSGNPATGPSVTMMTNPNDPYGKLLVISGRNDAELKTAALAVALGSKALSGATALIDRLDPVPVRIPYDAPNWLPADRPVKLGELVDAQQLHVSGYSPREIIIPLRLPPDLYEWRNRGAPLQLKYRYTPQQFSTNSALLVHLNDHLIRSMQLPSIPNLNGEPQWLEWLKKDDSLPREASMYLPLDISTFKAQLQLRYMYDYIKQGECRDVIVEDMRGQIEPDSTLDLSGLDHYTPMPDLAKFRDSGFPFTRLADLSETAVVMPDANGPEVLSAYLTVFGRFGDSTGYPTTGVQVIQARDVETVSDKDLLVLASASDQPLLKLWTDSMPARSESSHHFFDLSDLALRIHDWFSPDSEAAVRKTRSTLAWSGSGTPYLAGFESPLKSGRSMVVIASSEPSRLEEVTAAMIGGDDYKELIQGRLAVIQDKQITSLTADQPYYVGQLGWFRHLQLLLSRHLGWLLFSVLLGFALLCALIFLGLRAQAKRRLS